MSSSVVPNSSVTSVSSTQTQNVAFRDHETSASLRVPSNRDDTYSLAKTEDSPLGEWLSRPIKIKEYTWALGTALNKTFNPWASYLDLPTVAEKLQHYYLFRGDLCLKVLINGSPMAYGRLLLSYLPRYPLWSDPYKHTGLDRNALLTTLSQAPHIYSDVTTSAGGEMCVPFFQRTNWFNIPLRAWDEAGICFLDSLTDLRHANAASYNMTVSIFAWLENVEFAIPTNARYETQAGEDEPNGLVSKPATAIAGVADALSNVPVLGNYAKATSMVARGVGSIARSMGFSRPGIYSDQQSFTPRLLSELAATDRPEHVPKLTVDSKQELTISPGTAGLGDIDEMQISSIVQREAYVAQASWSVNDAVGQELLRIAVQPLYYSEIPITATQNKYFMNPSGYISQIFELWHGGMKYHLSVVASRLHRGRLLVQYDPWYVPGVAASDFNVRYSRIIDIADNPNLEMSVGWCQDRMWLQTPNLQDSDTSSTRPVLIRGSGILKTAQNEVNGIITVSVLNELTSPGDVAAYATDVSVLLFVAGGDDLQFARPTGFPIREVNYNIQIGEDDQKDAQSPQSGDEMDAIGPQETPNMLNLVTIGEKVDSLRTVIKRYQMVSHFTGNVNYNQTVTASRTLYFPLRDSTTLNRLNVSAIMCYVQMAFAGHRGSTKRKIHITSNSVFNQRSYIRRALGEANNSTIIVPNLATSAGFFTSTAANTFSGAFATGISTQPWMEFEVPYYQPYRFDDTHRQPEFYGYQLVYTQFLDATNQWSMTEWMCAAEDYTCFWFLGAPGLKFSSATS